ncbi:hypothetical protein KIY82_gp14 [Mycobacterium phage Centaur]|uniref:Uncharacterized protein n=1 Tax=Mycobacterium phage Centaur TaxID=2488784 RepID=A0A3G8FF94_9CAUD|nr:hypothetical protein KIY82_gp14 [Mycobacterium phage Centaur]AOZ64036.1 hypothetical protein SEA_BAEHEXIC_92 [Mycobacterium phage Baehexic]AZF93477.1 hypothetical protein SEA_CENTAUR_93 [Mycobacterium phage Centaur]
MSMGNWNITTTARYDFDREGGPTPRELMEAMWPIYYHGIACHPDNSIAAGGSDDGSLYSHAQATVKGLLRREIPDIPMDFMWDKILDSGELLSEKTLRELWIDSLATDY